ncbi:MAG: ribosomal protein S18 acetylase RimI-like enzyme [Flavobacterium sp.]|jgi:ribosomal protein S18 acetylase RimI-like enzyme
MTKIEIRKAYISDLESIQKIAAKTFRETFAVVNTPENIIYYLEENFNKTQLTKELSNAESSFYLATLDQKIIGYLKINFGKAQTEIMNEQALEIQRIYVLQEFHGKKVGQLFIDEVLNIAKLNTVSFIWLGVWEKNHRALGFYRKNNFSVFDEHVFTLGDDKQTDLLMKLETQN